MGGGRAGKEPSGSSGIVCFLGVGCGERLACMVLRERLMLQRIGFGLEEDGMDRLVLADVNLHEWLDDACEKSDALVLCATKEACCI